ncbi:MAG TPA: SemiSWEET transporter [Patescibacteria group bacterium]|nr:SemiSWEET transporter [Patescibacteria group bacterium]
MIEVEVIGIIAGTLTTASFLPQVLRIVKTKHTKDLSLPMYIAFVTGVAIWLVYGILLGSLSVILANSITLVLAGMILVFKLKYG